MEIIFARLNDFDATTILKEQELAESGPRKKVQRRRSSTGSSRSRSRKSPATSKGKSKGRAKKDYNDNHGDEDFPHGLPVISDVHDHEIVDAHLAATAHAFEHITNDWDLPTNGAGES